MRPLRFNRVDMTTGARVTVRTATKKYNEALQVTRLIPSELADIEDDVEFERYLGFLMNQWRNIRQRRRVTGSDADTSMIDSAEPACTHPSQVHSTYPEDLGDVAMVGARGVVIEKTGSIDATCQLSQRRSENEDGISMKAGEPERDEPEAEPSNSLQTWMIHVRYVDSRLLSCTLAQVRYVLSGAKARK